MADRATAPARIIAAPAVLVLTAACAACTLLPPAHQQLAAGACSRAGNGQTVGDARPAAGTTAGDAPDALTP